jgi:MoxR-like ATPase
MRKKADESPRRKGKIIQIQIHKMMEVLNEQFVEREEAIYGIVLGLLSQKHVFFLSSPGQAKSALFKSVVGAFKGSKAFKIQLDKQTRKEEVVGPIKVSTLGKDLYEHNIEGYLPDADVALIDEIWKANASILDVFLWQFDESREFKNGAKVFRTPLIAAFVCSNELPESDGLSAHYDRCLLRYKLDDIVDDANFIKMLETEIVGCPDIMSISDLKSAQEDVKNVDVKPILQSLAELRRRLAVEAGVRFSPRRWKESLMVLRASAWLDQRDEVAVQDFEVLQNVFWDKPEDKTNVVKIIVGMASPNLKKAMELQDKATEAYTEAMKQKSIAQGTESGEKIKTLLSELRKIKRERRIDEIVSKVEKQYKEILRICLNYDIK